MGETYPPGLVLTKIADNLDRHHSELRVTLPSNHFTQQEGLSATLDCVGELSDRVFLPTTNPARRQALRRQALESKHVFDGSPRPIRAPGKLKPDDIPPRPSPERRALLKKKFLDENEHPSQPYVLQTSPLRTEHTLAAIIGNATLSAVDWEPGMPECQLSQIEMLWDTGAQTTIITKDILDEQFQAHLSDPVHRAYRNQDGTRVQISFALEFTNSVLVLDHIAWVVDKEFVPNRRSGIILGQKGFIDSLQLRVIPRSILEAQGQAIDEKFWGDLILESFVDVDGSLKEF